ncbi:hypothetical protein [Micromonospora sp. NBC_00617]|uniref:hypothetical protein n=1 Tax=Micromonospora sp. NBC_00617 TaxID=2903587 RepID=UPI0030E345EE
MIDWVGWDSDECAVTLGKSLKLAEDFNPRDATHISKFEKMNVGELREALALHLAQVPRVTDCSGRGPLNVGRFAGRS